MKQSGHYSYIGPNGKRIGDEVFDLRSNGEGFVLHSRARIAKGEVERDVFYAVDSIHRPLEAHLHVRAGGKFEGSAWLVFGDTGIECQRIDAARQRSEERDDRRSETFGTHALVNDGWYAARALREPGGAGACWPESPVSSISEDGAGTPGLQWTQVVVGPLSKDSIDVPAGRFDCWLAEVSFASFPPIQMWIRRCDGLLVRQYWSFLDSHYRLESLSDER